MSVSKPYSTRENVLFTTPNNAFMMDHKGLQYSTECLFVFRLTLLIVWFLDMCTLGRAKMRENACPRKVATGPVEPVPGKAGDTITLLKYLGSPPALRLSQFTNSICPLAYSPTLLHIRLQVPQRQGARVLDSSLHLQLLAVAACQWQYIILLARVHELEHKTH